VLVVQDPPIYLIYQQGRGSCDGVGALLDLPPAPLAGAGRYYLPDVDPKTECTCNLPITNGPISVAADIGVSDVYQDSCAAYSDKQVLPAGVADFLGPNQVMTFVVPAASSQRLISRDAAHFIYAFGGNSNQVAPWNSQPNIFQRTEASGTQSMIAKAIGVTASMWLGTSVTGSGDMLNAVTAANSNAAAAESTIGILAVDLADDNRKMGPSKGLVILGYQHTGQSCAYWPDSTPTAFDKINVRDGHYPIWGPIHFLTNVGGDGRPTNPDVAAVTDYLTGVIDTPVELLRAEIKDAHTVPQCAMKVTRSKEIGPYQPYHPAKPCRCFFEKQNGAGADCVACSDSMPCAAGQACNFGYCEAM